MAKPLSCHHTLELVDAPLKKPISLNEVKDQLRVEHTDEDLLINRLINVAIAYTDVKGVLGQAMITQKWGQWIAANPPKEVKLLLGPVQGVTAIRYYDVDGVLQLDDYNNYDIFGTESYTTISPKTNYSWPTTQQRVLRSASATGTTTENADWLNQNLKDADGAGQSGETTAFIIVHNRDGSDTSVSIESATGDRIIPRSAFSLITGGSEVKYNIYPNAIGGATVGSATEHNFDPREPFWGVSLN